MKIAHRAPAADWFAVPVSDPVDPEYEAEVQQATQKAEREYQKARECLRHAEERLAEAMQRRQARKRVLQLQQEVDLRRAELKDCECLMMAMPVMHTDKQVRHRTGLDDHLELGILKRPKRKKPLSSRAS